MLSDLKNGTFSVVTVHFDALKSGQKYHKYFKLIPKLTVLNRGVN